MLHDVFVKRTEHPRSHNCLTAINAPVLSCGIMCPLSVIVVVPGRVMVAVCVDDIRLPSGNCALMGDVVLILLEHGELTMRKLLVAPESIIADLGDGGDRDRGRSADSKIIALFILSSLLAPIFQACCVVGVVHPLPLPFMRLWRVAVG